jgi:polysaccharide export outer membrane protein
LLVAGFLALGPIPFCAAQPVRPGAGTELVAPPASLAADLKTNELQTLETNDVILVKVYQEEDLETRAVIDKTGTVTLPLLGPVTLAGKTLAQAAAEIQEQYAKDYLVNPRVTVNIVNYGFKYENPLLNANRQTFAVLGQVQRPGVYEIPEGRTINLIQAIAMAGGFARSAAPSKVTVQRVENGESKVYRLDAEQMASGQTAKPFEILPEDLIMVKEKVF